MVTLRVFVGGMLAGAVRACWYAVPDGDLFGADEDVFDQQPQYSLAFGDGSGGGAGAQLDEEAFQVAGEPEVGVAVGGLGVEGIDLAAEVCFASAQVGHPCAQLVDGDELLGVGADHSGDRGGGLGRHVTSDGEPKLVAHCSYPLTATGVVSRVYTDLMTADVSGGSFVVTKAAPGVSRRHLERVTAGRLVWREQDDGDEPGPALTGHNHEPMG
jgi:hypothetical protein